MLGTMGSAKTAMMEWDERGYGPVDDYAVCPDHIHDAWLAAQVREVADGDGECTYCGGQGAASLEEVMPYVMDAVRGFYAPAITHLGWGEQANAPGGEEVLYSISEGIDFDEAVAHDIAEALSHNDDRWVPLREHPAGWLGAGWDRFCHWVTAESRFLLGAPEQDDFKVGEPPQTMLEAIGDLILEEGLLDTLPEATPVFRARSLPAGVVLKHPRDFSAPPDALAKPGRMNSRGISLFYGATDPETAAIEVYAGHRRAAVAEFKTLQPLEVVDLTKLPEFPSIYNVEQHRRWDSISFLKHFTDDIAKPVDRDGNEDLAYLPSQAVTEYLRLALPAAKGIPIHGLLFRSSRLEPETSPVRADKRPVRGVNVVLFCGSHGGQSDDQLFDERDAFMRLRHDEQWLRMEGGAPVLYEYGPPSVVRSRELLDGAQ